MSARSEKKRRIRRRFFRLDLERIARIWEVVFAPATSTRQILIWVLAVIYGRPHNARVGLPSFWYGPIQGFTRRPYEFACPDFFVIQPPGRSALDCLVSFPDPIMYYGIPWGLDVRKVRLVALLYLPRGSEAGTPEHERDMGRVMGEIMHLTQDWLDRTGLRPEGT